jgi:hypothetical protein
MDISITMSPQYGHVHNVSITMSLGIRHSLIPIDTSSIGCTYSGKVLSVYFKGVGGVVQQPLWMLSSGRQSKIV